MCSCYRHSKDLKMVRQRKMPITTAIKIATETIRQAATCAQVYCNNVCITEWWSDELSGRELVKRERAKLAVCLMFGIRSVTQLEALRIKIDYTGNLIDVVRKYVAYFER